MRTARTKEGIPVHVQSDIPDDEPDWRDKEAFAAQYRLRGYAIARGLLPPSLADAVVESFRDEVKTYDGAILRQLTVRMEPNKFSSNGFMTNTILSVQDMVDPRFETFRRNSLDVLTHERVQNIVTALIGEQAKCVESMYFESSARGTISHADCHFMDSSRSGGMVAAWFALEDIHPGAGRFYLMPESHLLGTDDPKFAHLKEFYNAYEELAIKTTGSFHDNSAATNAALRVEHHKLLAKGLSGLSFKAPMMRKGDAVFWGARVLHGSLNPEEANRSRNSLTAHYIGKSHDYVQYGAPTSLNTRPVNGMPVHHLRSQRPSEEHA